MDNFNITSILLVSGLFYCLGNISGKCCRGLNPFLMLVALFFFAITKGLIAGEKLSDGYLLAYALGFVSVWGNSMVQIKTAWHKLKHAALLQQLKQLKHRAEAERKQQRLQAEAEIRQVAEELRQLEAEFKQRQAKFEQQRRQEEQKAQQKQQQKADQQEQQSSPPQQGLNAEYFTDACEILGVNPGQPLAEYKQAYRQLSAIYHPDKVANLSQRRQQQVSEEFKLINQAWQTVQKTLK